MSYCTTLTAINSLMSRTCVAPFGVSQVSKGKSAALTCTGDEQLYFLPLVPSGTTSKDNYSIKHACRRQDGPAVRTVNLEPGDLYITPSCVSVQHGEHATVPGKGCEDAVSITSHKPSNRTATLPHAARPLSAQDLSSLGQPPALLQVACLLNLPEHR